MYQYLLFDLDGTLTDSKPGIINCVSYALDYFGIENRDPAFLNQFVGPPLTVSFRDFCGFDEAQAKAAAAKYRERYSTVGLFENAAFDGAVEMLKQLKTAGKTIALSTSKPEAFATQIIERYGLAPYIDNPVGATMDTSRQDKPDVIREALRQLEIDTPEKRAQTVMIGDRNHDILGAQECGLDSIGCGWGYAEQGELADAQATYIFDTIPELTEFLLGRS
jgi:phosphoglycolate phosphatase